MGVVIVTGSGGLIGSEAVRHFVASGSEVIGLENDMRSHFFGPEASTDSTTQHLVREFPEFRHVDIDIRVEKCRTLLFRSLGERHDIGSLEHGAKISAARANDGVDDVKKVGTIRINDVVLPVGVEDAAVGFEVALVGGDRVGALKGGEEIRKQVDKHQRPGRGWRRSPASRAAR